MCHVDLCSFDMLDILEVDESFQVECIGEGGGGGVGLEEGFDFDEGFDFLFFSVVSEREQDLRSGREFGVGVVVRDDLEVLDGLFVFFVSEGGCSLLEVLLDLLLGEASDCCVFGVGAGGEEEQRERGEQRERRGSKFFWGERHGSRCSAGRGGVARGKLRSFLLVFCFLSCRAFQGMADAHALMILGALLSSFLCESVWVCVFANLSREPVPVRKHEGSRDRFVCVHHRDSCLLLS